MRPTHHQSIHHDLKGAWDAPYASLVGLASLTSYRYRSTHPTFNPGYAHYKALLEKINGCVEMGIRILLPNDISMPDQNAIPHTSSGRDYLAVRKKFYSDKDRLTLEQKSFIEKICKRLSGCFRESRKEYHSENGLLSLYFLVPKGELETFRIIFQEINGGDSAKVLLSGPWPPYNFVVSKKA